MRELQFLPECAWNLMAQLLTACADAQFLPESYCWAATAMLPKDGGPLHREASSYHVVCSSVAGLLGCPLAADSKLTGILCASVDLWCEERSHDVCSLASSLSSLWLFLGLSISIFFS